MVIPFSVCEEYITGIPHRNYVSGVVVHKKAIALRQKNVDLIVDGSFEALDTCDEVVAYRRANDNDSEEIICINNMSVEEHEVSIDDTYEVLLSNADVNYKDHKYQLSPWQTIVLKK